jgi:hypothetical protein
MPEHPPSITPVAEAALKGAGKGALPPQEPDLFGASLDAAIAAKHDDPNHWMVNLPQAFEEDFSDLIIYFDGNQLEIWRLLADGGRTLVDRYLLTVVAFLRNFNARDRHGAPRSLAEVLDQGSVTSVDVTTSEYYGYTFEQVAQYWPDEMDDLADTRDCSGMIRVQIALRLYVTLRRQLLTVLLRIMDMNQTD